MKFLSKLPFNPKTIGAKQLSRYPLVVYAANEKYDVEYRRIGTKEWVDWNPDDLSLHNPSFLNQSCEWRVKGSRDGK